MREPDAARHPACLLEKIDRPQAIHLEAEPLFVLGLAEMGVELAVVALGKLRAFDHEILRDRERRTRRERDANLRAGLWIVEQLQHALAVGEDRLFVLHHAVGRQAAILLRQIHRAARDGHAHAKGARLLDLDVDRVLKTIGIEIMMIGGGGAAREHKLGQREPRRQPQVIGLEARPDRIERDEPGEQRLVDGGRVGAGQRLVEMMMRVDEPRQHDMARGVERCVNALRRLPRPTRSAIRVPSTTRPRSAPSAKIANGSLIHVRTPCPLNRFRNWELAEAHVNCGRISRAARFSLAGSHRRIDAVVANHDEARAQSPIVALFGRERRRPRPA